MPAWQSILNFLRNGARQQSQPKQTPPPSIGANHMVAQVIRWFPGTADVFRAYGLSQLNPMRLSIAQAAAQHDASLPQLLTALNGVVRSSPGHKKRAGCKGCGC